MRVADPEWEELQAKPFGAWIPKADLMYRSAELRRMMELGARLDFTRPAEVEVGSNRGRFLAGLCQARRETHFFGLELKRGLCQVAQRRLDRAGLHNGKVINGDARLALPILFGEASLSAIYVLFPDPWWKKRHAKRRLLDESFLTMARWLLCDGGVLVVKSDVGSYIHEVSAALQGDSGYALLPVAEVPGAETWALSTRERHCVEDGLPIYSVCARLVRRWEPGEETGVLREA